MAGETHLMTWPSLLLVDDDAQMLETLVCYFEKRGFHVAPAASLAEAKSLFRRHKAWALVISDFHLPDGTGGDLYEWAETQPGAKPPFLLMSGSLDAELLCAGLDFLPKPFPLHELERRVRLLLEARNAG